VNLRHKQYCFFNEQLSKSEYVARLEALDVTSHPGINAAFDKFLRFASSFPHKHLHGVKNEEVSGDYLNQCKNAHHCYDSSELRDCKYVCNSERMKNAYDVDTYGGIEGAENVCECHSVGRGAFRVMFGNNVYRDISEALYCDNCAHVHDVFGCVSLHHKKHCILNKQYSKEEYEKVKSRLIEHMEKTGERGEFFPIRFSPFAYNETMAALRGRAVEKVYQQSAAHLP